MNWWLPILCLWTGALLGFLMGVFLVGCRETVHSREDDLLIKPKRPVSPPPYLSMHDLLMLAGSEGDNLPRTPQQKLDGVTFQD